MVWVVGNAMISCKYDKIQWDWSLLAGYAANLCSVAWLCSCLFALTVPSHCRTHTHAVSLPAFLLTIASQCCFGVMIPVWFGKLKSWRVSHRMVGDIHDLHDTHTHTSYTNAYTYTRVYIYIIYIYVILYINCVFFLIRSAPLKWNWLIETPDICWNDELLRITPDFLNPHLKQSIGRDLGLAGALALHFPGPGTRAEGGSWTGKFWCSHGRNNKNTIGTIRLEGQGNVNYSTFFFMSWVISVWLCRLICLVVQSTSRIYRYDQTGRGISSENSRDCLWFNFEITAYGTSLWDSIDYRCWRMSIPWKFNWPVLVFLRCRQRISSNWVKKQAREKNSIRRAQMLEISIQDLWWFKVMVVVRWIFFIFLFPIKDSLCEFS